MRPVNKAKETVVRPTKAILGGVAWVGKTHESTIFLRMGMRSHGGGTPNAPITITAIILSMRYKRHALGTTTTTSSSNPRDVVVTIAVLHAP